MASAADQGDQLVAGGAVEPPSNAVLRGFAAGAGAHRRRQVGDAIVEGYRRQPQTEQEVGWADAATAAMIAAEPW